MAIEGQEQAVEQPGGASSTADAQKPVGDNKPAADSKPASQPSASAGQNEDYEKRFKGLTADLKKEREARQRYEQDLAAAKAEVAAERKRVQALAGLEPKSELDIENEAIRARLKQLGVPNLSQEDLDALKEVRAMRASIQQTQEHYWGQHARQMVSGVYEAIEKELGGKLSERQQQRVLAEYVRTVEADEQLAERHERGDKTLIAQFAKELTEDLFEPARRKYTQQETQRYRPVPSGKDRGIVTHGEKKIDVTDSKAVEDLLVKGFRERNGEFTGRK